MQDTSATPTNPIVSASGKYVLQINEIKEYGIILWNFSILSVENEVLFISKQFYDIRHTIFFLWDNSDNIWVYSGDIGTYIWKLTDQSWKKIAYKDCNLTPPTYLIENRPKVFKKN